MTSILCLLALVQLFTLGLAVPEIASPKSLGRRNAWGSKSYQTESFVTPTLEYIKYGNTAPGLLFLTPAGPTSSTNATIIMTEEGELVWHSKISNYYTDLRTQPHNGSIYLTFWNSSLNGPTRSNSYGSTGQNWPCQVDLHEAEMTYRDTLLVTVYNVTQADLRSVNGSQDGWALDSQIYEVDPKTENILFSWKHSDHFDELPFNQSNYPLDAFPLYKLGYSQSSPWDPFHINSIQALDDGYLISSRHYWKIYKIFNNGTIDWQMQGAKGDGQDFYTLPPAIAFHWQHHVRFNSTCGGPFYNMTLFNNMNSEVDNGSYTSTGMTFLVDTQARTMNLGMTITMEDNFTDVNDKVYVDSQGSHQVLPNGNLLIGYGQVPMVKEFDPEGNVVYSVQFGPVSYTAQTSSFRVFRLDNWHATPYYPPKVLARRSTNGTTAYMSWNGATDIDTWLVSAWPTGGESPPKQSVKKTGFETSVLVNSNVADGEVNQVQVQALCKGILKGTSEIVAVV